MDETTCQDSALSATDAAMASAIDSERQRQHEQIELIASENYCSKAVREAMGSVLTDKYAEGYPGARWYGGCEWMDKVEKLAIERAKKLFGAEHANVQPHSGSQANMAVYMAAVRPGTKILGMSLAHGGHLTHGHKSNFSGELYQFVSYGVDRKTGMIDYDEVRRIAEENNPGLIIAGASAYSRAIDYEQFRDIADKVGAFLMVDMAHIAGLIAADLHPDPVPHADFVSSTTHKTLRGPRSGFILCKEEHARQVDASVFPGIQGGPLMHVVAAKGVGFLEAMKPEFKEYQQQCLLNSRAMAEHFIERGVPLVSGGTDNHLMLLDLSNRDITGKEVTDTLAIANITVNKNAIPFDPRNPAEASGIRIGTPAITTRGMKEDEVCQIADWIVDILTASDPEATARKVRGKTQELSAAFPIHGF
ncbi:MAG: serine hydroxymethyltransferase [Candidatus Brocadiia bacterium]